MLIVGLLMVIIGIVVFVLNLIGENSRIIGIAIGGIGIVFLIVSRRLTEKA